MSQKTAIVVDLPSVANARLPAVYEAVKNAKRPWVQVARKAFTPTERQPCQVCGRYKSLSHAHHIMPLAMQFDAGYETPDQTHVWLCPTHHAAIHILMNQVITSRYAAGRCQVDVLCDLTIDEICALLVILDSFKSKLFSEERAV